MNVNVHVQGYDNEKEGKVVLGILRFLYNNHIQMRRRHENKQTYQQILSAVQ